MRSSLVILRETQAVEWNGRRADGHAVAVEDLDGRGVVEEVDDRSLLSGTEGLAALGEVARELDAVVEAHTCHDCRVYVAPCFGPRWDRPAELRGRKPPTDRQPGAFECSRRSGGN